MYDRGRHDQHTQLHQESRYWLRQGMARVALRTKLSGKPEVDARGTPLKYSNEMAERHSTTTIQRWADGMDAKAGNRPSQVWCRLCKNLGRNPWRAYPHWHED